MSKAVQASNDSALLAEVKAFIRRSRTWFDLEDESSDRLSYATRDNGDVGDERAGRADVMEARRLKTLVEKEFPGRVGLDTADEWVYLDVSPLHDSRLAGYKESKVIKTLWMVEDPTADSEIIDIVWGTDSVEHFYNVLTGGGRSILSRHPAFHDDETSARKDAMARLTKFYKGNIPEWVLAHEKQDLKVGSAKMASEVSVSKDGIARDDEGNTWKTTYPPGTYFGTEARRIIDQAPKSYGSRPAPLPRSLVLTQGSPEYLAWYQRMDRLRAATYLAGDQRAYKFLFDLNLARGMTDKQLKWFESLERTHHKILAHLPKKMTLQFLGRVPGPTAVLPETQNLMDLGWLRKDHNEYVFVWDGANLKPPPKAEPANPPADFINADTKHGNGEGVWNAIAFQVGSVLLHKGVAFIQDNRQVLGQALTPKAIHEAMEGVLWDALEGAYEMESSLDGNHGSAEITKRMNDVRGSHVDIDPVVSPKTKARGYRIRVQGLPLMKHAARNTNGDRKDVGLFIPLSDELAAQFPEKEEDQSPPHCTLLYVGEVTAEREAEFLRVLGEVLSTVNAPVHAWIHGLDSFVHPDKERKVFWSPVRFSLDMATIRARLREALEAVGFDIQDSFPLAYNAHATLGYVPNAYDATWDGPTPTGSWSFSEIEVWGLPKLHKVSLGGGASRNPTPAEIRRWAGIRKAYQAFDR